MQQIFRNSSHLLPRIRNCTNHVRTVHNFGYALPQTTPRNVRHSSHAAEVNGKVVSLSAEDRFDIMELCHRFDHAINRLDQQAAGCLFSSNGLLHTPRGAVQGPDAISAFFKSVEPMAKGNRHLTVDIVIDAAANGMGNAAKAQSYRLLVKASAPTALVASGTIEDDLIKEDGQWRFASRKFVMDPPATQQ